MFFKRSMLEFGYFMLEASYACIKHFDSFKRIEDLK